MNDDIRLSRDSATALQVLEHLESVDHGFLDELRTRVSDVEGYVAKFVARAHRIEAWRGEELVGIVAVYANDPSGTGFVTHVSVASSAQGSGLGRELMSEAIVVATEAGMRTIELSVGIDNERARHLYATVGFNVVHMGGSMALMRRSIE